MDLIPVWAITILATDAIALAIFLCVRGWQHLHS